MPRRRFWKDCACEREREKKIIIIMLPHYMLARHITLCAVNQSSGPGPDFIFADQRLSFRESLSCVVWCGVVCCSMFFVAAVNERSAREGARFVQCSCDGSSFPLVPRWSRDDPELLPELSGYSLDARRLPGLDGVVRDSKFFL